MGKNLGWYLPELMILKITLIGSDPKIWRRVEVDSGLTLHHFHYVIQKVFDWDNSHLYHFLVPPGGKLTRKAMCDARRYHVLPPDPVFGDDDDLPSDEAMIGRIFTPECKQIIYEYDFGDSWDHLVKLEKRTPDGDPDHVPRCLAGENAAPKDDMGGIYGYYHRIEAFHDPSHELHEEAVGWLGADFNETRFHLDQANRRLAAAFKPVPKRRTKQRKRDS